MLVTRDTADDDHFLSLWDTLCPVKKRWEPPAVALGWRMSKEAHQSGGHGQFPLLSLMRMKHSLGSRFVSCPSLQLLAPRQRRWDGNLEPHWRSLCNSYGVSNPLSTEKLHPKSPKELLGRT